MVVRISDKTQNYSKVTKLLVKPFLFYKCSLYNNSNKYELKTQSISDLKYMIQFKGSQ